MSHDLKHNLHYIHAGTSRHEALAVFLSACNKPDTLFITDRWIGPRLEALTRFLADPITQDQSEALVDAVMQRVKLDTVLYWLEYMSEMAWREFTSHAAQVAAETDRTIEEAMMQRHLAELEEIKAWPRPVCPKCGLADEVVPIFYGLPTRPVLPANGVFVRAGCNLRQERWHCKRCAPIFESLEDLPSISERWSGEF
jgi:hypothetical protein